MAKTKKDLLIKAQDIFRYCAKHPATLKFRENAKKSFRYYDGDQYDTEAKEKMLRVGQKPQVLNKIEPFIKGIIGIEVATRKKIVFKAQGYDEEVSKLAEAMSSIAFSIQERNHYAMRETNRFKHGLICGVGWGGFRKQPISGKIDYEVIHPLEIYFDPDDTTDNLENMSYLCRVCFMSVEEAKVTWKHAAKEITELADSVGKSGLHKNITDDTKFNDRSVYGVGIGKSIKYIEVQRKNEAVCYEGFAHDGNYFKTFNKEEALEIIANPDELKVTVDKQVVKTVFCDDILLEHTPVLPNLPGMVDFSYVPFVYSKLTESNIPVGLTHSLFDIQDQYNLNITRQARDINSFRVIVDKDAFSTGELEEVRHELKQTDGIIMKKAGSQIEFKDNLHTAAFHERALNNLNQELQFRTGFYDEALGKQTNATSGIAIQSRQTNSVNNQRFAFDKLNLSRKREGVNLLALIQTSGDKFIETTILNDSEKETLILNVSQEIDGKMHLMNDIRTIPAEIFIEQIEDYGSPREHDNDKFLSLLQNPQILPLFTSLEVCRRLGFMNPERAAAEIKALLESQRPQPQEGEEQMEQEGINE